MGRELVGVSTAMSEIQDSFLKYEISYKGVQNIFTKIYKIISITKKANLENINEQTYEIAKALVDMSEHYMTMKSKVYSLDNNTSKLDEFLKNNIIYTIEQNLGMLSRVEVKINNLLDSLVGKSVISRKKANKLMQEEERKDKVIFVSKYEVINTLDRPEFILSWILKKYIFKFITILLIDALLISGTLDKLSYWLAQTLSKSLNYSETINNGLVTNIKLVETMSRIPMQLATGIIGLSCITMLLMLMINMTLDISYVYLPFTRQIFSEKVLEKLNIGADIEDRHIQIEKFQLVRAKEILTALESLSEYKNNTLIPALKEILNCKTNSEVLTLEENYAIILTESIYTLVNTYHKTNRKLVAYCLGLDGHISINPIVMKILALKQRLGL